MSRSKSRIQSKRALTRHGKLFDHLINAREYSETVKGAVVIDNTALLQHSLSKGLALEDFHGICLYPPFEKTFLEFKYGNVMKGVLVDRLDDNLLQATYFSRSITMNFTACLATWTVTLNENGCYKTDTFTRLALFENAELSKEQNSLIANLILALFTLAFLNCRNVVLVDCDPNREASSEYQRNFGKPLTKFKTIALKPIGKRYESTDPKEYQGLMPEHLRMGGWMHFTEERPAFGKPWGVGTFWRPPTVVGEAKNGTVIKDYKVIAS